MEETEIKYNYGLPDKKYVLALQLDLLQKALAPWPRRANPILVVNCGDGRYFNLLWQCGFDIEATEPDPETRKLALQRRIPGLEVLTAREDMLPFDDDSFDWVITHLKAVDLSGINAAIQESLRVARRGMLLTFWNSSSLPALICNMGCRKIWPQPAASWWTVWRQMRALHTGRICCRSTLYGPTVAWRRHCRFAFMNTLSLGAPLGAWSVIRLDMAPALTVTPLALRLGAAEQRPQPLMEYAKKYTKMVKK